MRTEGEDSRLVAIDWQEDAFHDVPDGAGSLSAADSTLVAALASDLASATNDVRAARAVLARLRDVLRAAGLPLGPAPGHEGHLEYAPRALVALARAVSEASSRLEANPMLVDVQDLTGRSRRQVARHFRTMRDSYGFEGASWREVLDTWRLQTGVALMTHPAATTATVARALGYGSTAAFCHACRRAGLPPPGDIRRRLQQLH